MEILVDEWVLILKNIIPLIVAMQGQISKCRIAILWAIQIKM